MKRTLSILKEKAFTFVASCFSVLFSLSILIEAKKYTDGDFFSLLCLFVALFLLFNEWVKVREIKNIYKGVRTFKTIAAFSLTMIFSIGLSTIGIYFWTNNVSEKEVLAQVEKSKRISELTNSYQKQIDLILNTSVESALEYKTAKENLDFWKSRNTKTTEERELARKNVESSQLQLADISNKFEVNKKTSIDNKRSQLAKEIEIVEAEYMVSNDKQSKNNFISWIFIGLTLLTEIIILYLAKELSDAEVVLIKSEKNKLNSNEYEKFVKGLEQLSSANLGQVVTFAQFMTATGLEWVESTKLRKLLERSGLISQSFEDKQINFNSEINLVADTFKKRYQGF